MLDCRHFKKSKIAISAVVCLIVMKFGTMTPTDPLNPIDRQNFQFLKSKIVKDHYYQNAKNNHFFSLKSCHQKLAG